MPLNAAGVRVRTSPAGSTTAALVPANVRSWAGPVLIAGGAELPGRDDVWPAENVAVERKRSVQVGDVEHQVPECADPASGICRGICLIRFGELAHGMLSLGSAGAPGPFPAYGAV